VAGKRFLSKAEVRDKVKLSYAEIARREKAGKISNEVSFRELPVE
jgi:hypothetical protein